MNNNDSLENMPPDIYFWIQDEIDGGDLDPFITYYVDRAKEKEGLFRDKADFINGFTLAVAYLNHERFTLEELRWVRIAMSVALNEALT